MSRPFAKAGLGATAKSKVAIVALPELTRTAPVTAVGGTPASRTVAVRAKTGAATKPSVVVKTTESAGALRPLPTTTTRAPCGALSGMSSVAD